MSNTSKFYDQIAAAMAEIGVNTAMEAMARCMIGIATEIACGAIEFECDHGTVTVTPKGSTVTDDDKAEIDDIKRQNAELMAQVGAFSQHMRTFSDIDSAFKATAWESRSNELLKTTPQQFLREIRADAGRAGYLACAEFYGLANTYVSKEGIERTANEYAEEIRQGEVK